MSGRDACREEMESLGKKQFDARDPVYVEGVRAVKFHFHNSYLTGLVSDSRYTLSQRLMLITIYTDCTNGKWDDYI